MPVNKISIIGTSQGGREVLIDRMLNSLSVSNLNIELVFVDQSPNDTIERIFDSYRQKVCFKLIKSGGLSLSKARNIAINQSSGNILTFCDDDAFYDECSLRKIAGYTEGGELIMASPVRDKTKNANYSGRNFPTYLKKLNHLDVLRFCLSVGTFIIAEDNNWIKSNVIFNEKLGVGAEIGGSEESELILRLHTKGLDVVFNPDLVVYHDDDEVTTASTAVLGDKYYSYGVGYGLILREFLFESKFLLLLELMNISLRCVVGSLISNRRMIHFYRLLGVWNGFLFKKL